MFSEQFLKLYITFHFFILNFKILILRVDLFFSKTNTGVFEVIFIKEKKSRRTSASP